MSLCHCGCGDATGPYASRAKHLKGKTTRYIPGHQNFKRTLWLEEDRGHETPCWIWQLYRNPSGYGIRSVIEDGVKTPRLAHRVIYMERRGPIPPGLELHHLCAVRECVNPDHLEPVTPNAHRRTDGRAKLSEDQVREIRQRHAEGEGPTALAAEFGISVSNTSDIVARRRWAWVT